MKVLQNILFAMLLTATTILPTHAGDYGQGKGDVNEMSPPPKELPPCPPAPETKQTKPINCSTVPIKQGVKQTPVYANPQAQ